ncbi:ABC transporter permease (plasmid) [Paraburkholderia sprentiae WSM5005]|uniref:ABC transporter permease n=1 Tax=Paraburkholderia sprentiae WSM5005 TaxID=754502 RepID=A0A1I9YU49_9BURK|nr:ABC transporter permease [Paraburkholderia sprentiae]APA89718.1 ABC transporter permease [Paraburkholderia sprentiae WSM5005]
MKRSTSTQLAEWTARNRWAWAALAVVLLWLTLSVVTRNFSVSSLSGVAVSSSFLALCALGQMAVVTTGRGNIDLSIASVMTLSAYLALIVMGGSDARLMAGVAATLGLGLAVGAVNAALVVLCRIPAIIATLATGYILATATLLANRAIPGFKVSPAIHFIATGRIGAMPVIVLVAMGVTALFCATLRYTAYGRMLSAVGQNVRAARLAGVRTARVTASAFLTSSVLAAVAGLLLGGYVGGAFLEMGQPYLLQSLGAVVLGGTLIFGGSATPLGTLIGSMLLVLVVTTMQIAGLPPGIQDVVQGIVIITVLALAGGGALRRSIRKARSATPPASGGATRPAA